MDDAQEVEPPLEFSGGRIPKRESAGLTGRGQSRAVGTESDTGEEAAVPQPRRADAGKSALGQRDTLGVNARLTSCHGGRAGGGWVCRRFALASARNEDARNQDDSRDCSSQ